MDMIKSTTSLVLFFVLSLSAYADLSAQIDLGNYINDMQSVAIPRAAGSYNHELVKQFLIDRLESLGYQVSLQNYGTGVNIIGRQLGATLPHEDVIVSAHYDSAYEDPSCIGADDNASGVVGVLEMARVLSHQTFDRTLTIAFWDEEELGLIGSKAYVANHNNNFITKMMLNFEMIGYTSNAPNSQTMPFGLELFFPNQIEQIKNNGYRADFIATIGDNSADTNLSLSSINQAAEINDLKIVGFTLDDWQIKSSLFRDFRRSDHAAFWEMNIPAIVFGDTANFRSPYYHCMQKLQDSLDTIDYNFAIKVVKVATAAATEALDK